MSQLYSDGVRQSRDSYPEECGFLARAVTEPEIWDEYAGLDEAWRSLIKERFSTGNLSDSDA